MGKRSKYTVIVFCLLLGFLCLLPLQQARAEVGVVDILQQVLKNQKIVSEFYVQIDTTIYLQKQLLNYQIEVNKTKERSAVTREDFWELKGTETGWILNNLPWIYLPPDFSLIQHALPAKKYSGIYEPLARIEEWYRLGEVTESKQDDLTYQLLELENPFQNLILVVDPRKNVITRIEVRDNGGQEIATISYQDWLQKGQAFLPSMIVVERSGQKLMEVRFQGWNLNPEGTTVVISEDSRTRELQELIAENPENANLHYQLAREHESFGRIEQAIREYQRAAKLAEKPEYLRSLRDVLYELQRWSEALPWAEKIMELEAVEAEDYFVLGEVYTRLYNPILAREAFEKAIEMDDDYIKAWERVYWIYLNLAEEDRTFLNKALNAAVKLVNLSPQEYEFHNYLGDVYLKLGRNDDAFQEYQKALELSPGNGWGYIKMARYYQAIDQNQLARQLYKKAVQVTGEWWSYEAYGNFLLEQKDYLEAVKALQAAHNLKPERVEISLQLGEAFLAENKPEKALQAWQEALQYAPGDIYTYLRVGRVMEEHGFAAEAEKVFQDASKLFDPGGPGSEWQEDALGEIYYFLGRAEYERGNLQQAIDYFQDGYPDLPHAGAVFLLGRYYLAAGELSAARQTWENCLQKAPDNRWLKTGLGLLNLACGNLEGAEWYFIGLGDDGVTSLLRGWRNLKPYEGLLAGQGGEEAPLAAAAARLKEGDLSGALEGFNLELQSDSHSLEAKLWKVILYSLTDDKREDEAYQALVADTANTDWSRLAGAFRQLADRIFQARIVLN